VAQPLPAAALAPLPAQASASRPDVNIRFPGKTRLTPVRDMVYTGPIPFTRVTSHKEGAYQMVLKRLGIAGAIAILPAMAQVSSTSAHAVALKAFQTHHGPIKIIEQHADGSVESTNWSGYAVTGSDFKGASGSWIEPAITCNKKTDTELAAFWVGLDGYNDNTVEQTGTLAACVNGQEQHLAWYEFYPKEAIIEIKSVPVSAGDKIATIVKYDKKTNNFTLTIKDETTGKHFSFVGTEPGTNRASAEWIAEAPCCVGNGVYPLPDFGTALFGMDSTSVAYTNDASDGKHKGPFNTFPAADVFAITMVNASGSHPAESVPSAPTTDGSSFSVQWVSP
jgi:hypothetical protein